MRRRLHLRSGGPPLAIQARLNQAEATLAVPVLARSERIILSVGDAHPSTWITTAGLMMSADPVRMTDRLVAGVEVLDDATVRFQKVLSAAARMESTTARAARTGPGVLAAAARWVATAEAEVPGWGHRAIGLAYLQAAQTTVSYGDGVDRLPEQLGGARSHLHQASSTLAQERSGRLGGRWDWRGAGKSIQAFLEAYEEAEAHQLRFGRHVGLALAVGGDAPPSLRPKLHREA